MAGDGALAIGIKEIQNSVAAFSGGSILDAEMASGFQTIISTSENTNYSAQAVPASATAGAYITLIGAGGWGGIGTGATTGTRNGGGGGGGGARVPQLCVPRSAMGATFSLTRGLAVSNGAGQASVFLSGGVTVAGGGGRRAETVGLRAREVPHRSPASPA